MPCGDFQHQSKADSGSRLSVYFIIINYRKIRKKTNVLPPLSPTPVPLCVIDIIMGTDHLKHTHRRRQPIYYNSRYTVRGLSQSVEPSPMFT